MAKSFYACSNQYDKRRWFSRLIGLRSAPLYVIFNIFSIFIVVNNAGDFGIAKSYAMTKTYPIKYNEAIGILSLNWQYNYHFKYINTL